MPLRSRQRRVQALAALMPRLTKPRHAAMQAGFFVGACALAGRARRSGRSLLLHHQAIQRSADFGKAACYHGSARIAWIGADANALRRLALLSCTQRDNIGPLALVLLTGWRRAPWRDRPSLDGAGCGGAGWSGAAIRWWIACCALSGSVANEECTGQVMNHGELRLTADEVRQDSTGTTRRDRITGQVMPMPATRLVARESVQQLVADQANGQTFQFEVVLIG